MKAAICRAFGEDLCVEEVNLAAPQAGEVRVDIAACAICHSDIHQIDGAWGGDLPIICGHEAAGTVVETGAEVERVEPGDRVIVTLIRACGKCFFCRRGEPFLCEHHFALADRPPLSAAASGEIIAQGFRTAAFAEEVVVHESQIFPIPDTLAMDEASLLACGVITGFGAVHNSAPIEPGENVVVIGAGGVGLNVIQGARLAGAGRIIVIDLEAEKRDIAKQFGAHDTIDPKQQDAIEEVKRLCHGRGADAVYVAVGAPAAIEQALLLLRRGGRLVLVGMPGVGDMVRFEAQLMAGDCLQVIGSKMGGTRLAHDMPKLLALYEAGELKLRELVSNHYPLSQINEAIAEVRTGRVLRNVIVFD